MSINHGETIRPVSDHKTTEEGKRNAEVLYWGDEMSDMEQHNSSLWQGKHSGKGPGLGQKGAASTRLWLGEEGKGPGRATMVLVFVCCFCSKAPAWLSVTYELI